MSRWCFPASATSATKDLGMEPRSHNRRRGRDLVRLALALLLFCGCGRNIGDRVVVEGGVSICSPEGWVLDKGNSSGMFVMRGEAGRLSVAVLDAPPPASAPEDLMDTLKTMSPELRVIKQADFNAGGGQGKEFVVSCLEDGRKQNGIVYLIGKNKKLCVLTFTVRGDSLDEWLDVFRESAGTLEFLETSGDENKDSRG